jgi:argininosuccinate lyase
MARLPDPPDPLFRHLNASVGFDRRLWRQDIAGSKAHVAALQRVGVVDESERGALEAGLDAVAGELRAGRP